MVEFGSKKRQREEEPQKPKAAEAVAVPTPGGPTPGGPTPGGPTPGEGVTPGGPVAKPKFQSEFSPSLLKIYYERMFPYGHMFAWLSYLCDPKIDPEKKISTKYWRRREFCFTMKDDVYIRYQSYQTMGEFRSSLKKKCPYKIDLGAIYNAEPKKKASCVNFMAEEKELVFDIDITDYDDVRSCCSGGAVCNTCWPLMTCSIKVLTKILEEQFGFRNKLWVFSGRRGIHCWVCDPKTQPFPGRIRSAIIHFLHTYTGGDNTAYKVDLKLLTSTGFVNQIHQVYKNVYPICEEYFIKCCLQEMDLFTQPRKMPDGSVLTTFQKGGYFFTMVNMIRDNTLKENIWKECKAADDKRGPLNSEQLWAITMENFAKYGKKNMKSNDKKTNHPWEGYVVKMCKKEHIPQLLLGNKMEIVFAHIFPRVDVEVTKGVNHLLKSPFCAHPKTGKLCVPMDYDNIDDFDPCNQPTLRTIHDELIATGDPAQTAIGAAIEVFERTFLNGLREAVSGMENYADE